MCNQAASIISDSQFEVRCAKGLRCLADTLRMCEGVSLNDRGHLPPPCLSLPLPVSHYEVYIWQ